MVMTDRNCLPMLLATVNQIRVARPVLPINSVDLLDIVWVAEDDPP